MSTANAKAQQKNCPVEQSGTVLQRLVRHFFHVSKIEFYLLQNAI
jgi:hypothetical protein